MYSRSYSFADLMFIEPLKNEWHEQPTTTQVGAVRWRPRSNFAAGFKALVHDVVSTDYQCMAFLRMSEVSCESYV